MNTNQFKKLIKECVREVIKEELSSILKEAIINNNRTQQVINENVYSEDKTISFNTNNVKSNTAGLRNMLNSMYNISEKPSSNPVPIIDNNAKNGANKFLDFFLDTAKNMTPQDMASLKNYGE